MNVGWLRIGYICFWYSACLCDSVHFSSPCESLPSECLCQSIYAVAIVECCDGMSQGVSTVLMHACTVRNVRQPLDWEALVF